MDAHASKTRDKTPKSIHSLSLKCNTTLDQFVSLLETSENQNTSSDGLYNERGRFRVWAANIGALQPAFSPKSLEHRLRDVKRLHRSVCAALERLLVSVERAFGIVSGHVTERKSTRNTGLDSSSEGQGLISELDELLLSVTSSINHLFSLSMLIRRQRPKGRFPTAGDFKHTESSPDITNVVDMFPQVKRNKWLAQRLGNAITERRHFIQYRQSHRESLAKSETVVPRSNTFDSPTIATTTATTFEDGTKSSITPCNSEDKRPSSTFTSATSFISVEANESTGRSVPELTDMVLDGIQLQYGEMFECPYCRTIQDVANRLEWKRHVFSDLQPYVCTFEDCPDKLQLFTSRSKWFQHEKNIHRRVWKCSLCGSAPDLRSKDAMARHISESHSDRVTEAQLPLILEMCEQPVRAYDSSSCPLCPTWNPIHKERSEKEFSRHLANHLQQIALAALPMAIDGLEIKDPEGSGKIESSGESDHMSVDSQRSIVHDPKEETKPAEESPILDNENALEDRNKEDAVTEKPEDETTSATEEEHIKDLKKLSLQAQEHMRKQNTVEAQAILQDFVELSGKVLGRQHPLRLKHMSYLAYTYITLSNLEEAKRVLQQVVNASKKQLGEEHTFTLDAMSDLAKVYDREGLLHLSITLQEQVLASRAKSLGESHAKTMSAMLDLSHGRMANSEPEKAIEALERLVELERSRLSGGGRSRNSLENYMFWLARAYTAAGREKEAAEITDSLLSAGKEGDQGAQPLHKS